MSIKSKPPLQSLILEIRGQKVILDADLAEIYGVPTKVFNQAVKRNADRFPVPAPEPPRRRIKGFSPHDE